MSDYGHTGVSVGEQVGACLAGLGVPGKEIVESDALGAGNVDTDVAGLHEVVFIAVGYDAGLKRRRGSAWRTVSWYRHIWFQSGIERTYR